MKGLRMSWIEGVGDEVTIAVAVLAILFIILVAWISTGITDIPFIRVVVVQLTRGRQQPQTDPVVDSLEADLLVQQPDNVDEVGLTGETEAEPAQHVAETVQAQDSLDEVDTGSDNLGASLSRTETVNQTEEETQNNEENDNAPIAIETLSASELRQRRVDFFKASSCSSSDNKTQVNEQNLKKKHEIDEKEEDKLPREDKSKLSECKSPSSKGLSDLASNLLNEELEHSSREQTESLNSQGEPGNQSREGDNQPVGSEASDEIRVRLKYLNDTQRLVKASPLETIGNFRRKHFTAELSQSKLVRFIFNGQDLRNDNSTLQACNIIDNSVVHCLITQPQEQPGQTGNQHDDGFDIGVLMFPLFGFLLGIVWYMRFKYRQFFNVTSTLTLGGITFLYIAALMSYWRGNRHHQHLE